MGMSRRGLLWCLARVLGPSRAKMVDGYEPQGPSVVSGACAWVQGVQLING